MDGTSCRQTNVSPTLCFNASHTVSGSTPPLTPSVNASPIAAALMNQIWLVTSFTTLPVPSAPQWMTLPSGANSAVSNGYAHSGRPPVFANEHGLFELDATGPRPPVARPEIRF